MKTGFVLVGLTCITAIHAPADEAGKVEQYRGMLLKRPENPVLFGRLVDAWLESGEMAGLKAYLEGKAAEGGAMDWRVLAVFRNFAGDEAGAIAALDEALRKAPDDGGTRLARAKALGAASRFEDALADLVAAAGTPELALEAGTLRGKFLARAGRPADAVKAWKEIIAANPKDEGLREDLIDLEIGEGLLDEAVAAARELADQTADPYQKALRRMRVAEILAQAGKKSEAVAEYTGVFGVSAENSWLEREVLARVAALFSREDDVGGLREFHEKLRDAWPRRVAVKKEAARSLLATGEGDEGVAMFREVLKVMPGDRAVRDEFIALLEGAGRLKEAADEISALLATAENDAMLWEKLAAIRKVQGDDAGLKTALDRAVALVPEGEAGRVSAAMLLERYGRAEDAEKTLREAVKTHGAAGEAGDALAVWLANHGKPEEAVALWREMAKTADREGLLRIVRSLTANGRAAESYGILASRAADFPGDPLWLAAICQAAQFADQAEEAIPQAFEWVRQAKTSGDLETALRQAAALVSRAKEPKSWIDQLAAKADPSVQELCLLAELHEAQGDSIEAERLLKKAMEGGDPLLAAAQRVRLFEMRGDLDAAVAATRDWLALPGGLKTEQVKRLVSLHERRGDPDAALAETENWRRIAPGDKLVWAKRAELLRGNAKPEEAVAELRRALAKFGADEETRANLAATLAEAGLNDEARRVYGTLYDEAESPASKVKWAGLLAELSAQEGREEELINDFKRRARDNPSSVAPLLALAEAYRIWQRPEDELQVVAEASRRKPEDVTLLHRLADLEEQAGSAEKAEAILKSAIRVQDTPENRRRLSAFWIRSGDAERGFAELLANKGTSNPREVERMVEPLMNSGDHETALRILSAEIQRHAADWRIAYLHALALKESGAADDALARFSALLDASGDLAGVQPLLQNNQMPWIFGGSGKMSAFRQFAYFQNMTRNRANRRMYHAMNQSLLPLPGSVTEVRWLALCQALDIASGEPDARERRMAAITAANFPDLEFFKSVHGITAEELVARLSREDAEPRLFRWYLESMNFAYDSDGNSRRVDSKVLRKGAELCAGSDLQLAVQLMGRIGTDGDDALGPDDARRLFGWISAMPADKRADYLGSLQMLATADDKIAPKDLREQAVALILAEFKAAAEKTGNTWIADSLALQWMREGRFDEATALLNQGYAIRNSPAFKAKAAQRMTSYGRIYLGGESQLAFPDVLTSTVNHVFMSEFGARGGNRGYAPSENQKKILKLLGEKETMTPGMPQADRKPIDVAKLPGMLPKIEDPYLRVLFAHVSEKSGLAAAEIDALLAARPDDVEALLVAAAYQTSVAKDPVKAYAALEKAANAAAPGPRRYMIDLHVYQAGLALAAKEEPKVDLDAARRAALRLRKTMGVDDDSKRSLAAGMTKLGLEEESKRYTAAPRSFSGARSPFSSIRMTGGMRPASARQNVNALISQGKREAAARQILRNLRALRAQMAMGGHSRYEEDQLFESIVSLKLEDEVIRVSTPAEGAGFPIRKDHALLISRLGRHELALPILRDLAVRKPGDIEVKAALLMALPENERKDYMLELTDAEFDADRIAQWFGKLLSRGGTPKFEDYLANVELFVGFIEKLPPSPDAKRNLSWVNYFAKDLFETYYFANEVRVKPLGARNRGNTGEFDKDRSAARETMARRLHKAMLRHPQTAEQGFILMMNFRADLGTSDEDLRAAAGEALLISSSIKEDLDPSNYSGGGRRQNLWVWRTTGGGGTSSGSPPNEVDPLTYLMRAAADGKGGDPITPDFIARVAESNPEAAKIIGDSEKIVASPGLDAFNAWKDTARTKPEAVITQVPWISRLAFFRKRADILDAMIDLSCDLALSQGNGRYGYVNSLTEGLSLAITETPGYAEKTRVIDRITRRLLGPPEAWSLYGENDGMIPGTIQLRVSAYQTMCQFLRNDRDSIVAMARFAAENRVAMGRYADLSNLSSYHWRNDGAAGNLAADWLSSGIFAPGPGPACALQDNDRVLFESMDSSAGNLSSDARKKLGEALLKTEGPERFWARLLGARISNNTPVAVAELDANAKSIAKWPPHARAGLARLVLSWFPAAEKSAGSSVRKLLADSRKKGDAETLAKAESYLKDGFPNNTQVYSIGNGEIGGLMRRLVREDAALAARLWLKLLEHFEAGRGGSSSSNGFRRSTTQYANGELCQTFGNGDLSLAVIADFTLKVEALKPGAASGLLAGGQDYYQRQMFDAWMRRGSKTFSEDKAVDALKSDNRALGGAVIALHRESSKEAKPLLAAMLALQGLSSYSNSFGSSSRPELLEWARKDLRKIDPALADALTLMLVMRLDKPSDADKAELRALFAKLVADRVIPEEIRASLAGQVLRRSMSKGLLGDADCTAAMSGMLTDLIKPERNWASEDSFACLEKLPDFTGVSAANAAAISSAIKAAPPAFANSGGSSNEAEARMNRFMLALALKSGDAAEVTRLVREGGAALRGKLDLAVMLWQGGHPAPAASLIARPGEYHLASRVRLTRQSDDGTRVQWFSREMEDALPGWLSSIEDAGQRFRIECLLASLPDAADGREPAKKRSDRVAALVGRFPAEAPKARVSRDEILAALGTEPVAARPLADEYLEAASRLNLGALLALRDGNNNYDPRAADASYVAEYLIRRAMRYETEVKGEAALVLKQLQSIVGVPNTNQEYMAGEMLRELGRWHAAFLALHLPALPEDRRKALAAKALEISDYLLISTRTELHPAAVSLAIVSGAAAGDGAGFDRWLEKLPHPQKGHYEECRKKQGLRGAFGGMRNEPFASKDHERLRREVLALLLRDPATLAREITHMTEISSLMDSGAFTRDDVMAVIDALPEDHPRRAEFLTEKAGIIGWRGGSAEDTLKAYDAAEAAAGNDKKLLDFTRSYRAMYLDNRASRTKDAIEIAKSINLDSLQERERTTMVNLLKKAEPATKKE